MAASFAQTPNSNTGDPAIATMAGAPTAGSCLVAIGQERSGQNNVANYTASITGLVPIGGDATLPTDGSARRSFRVWAKTADGSESGAVSIDDGTANGKRATLAEIANTLGLTNYSLVASHHVHTGTGSDGATGLTASSGAIAAGKYILLTVGTWRNAGNHTNVDWSHTPDATFNVDGGLNGLSVSIAIKEVTGGTTYSTTLTWFDAGNEGNLELYVLGVADVHADAPTFVAEQETAFNETTPKSVAAALSALTGDILVEVAGMESSNNTSSELATPTGGSGITRTAQEIQNPATDTQAEARLWTATIPSDQSVTPSFSRTGAARHFAGTALLFRDSDGIGAAESTNNGTGSGAPSLDITTTEDHSAIVVIAVDWNAVDGASRVWRTVNGFTPTAANGYERSYLFSGADGTYYVAYYPDAGAAGLKTVGLSAPTGQRYVIAAVEVLGAVPSGGGGKGHYYQYSQRSAG